MSILRRRHSPPLILEVEAQEADLARVRAFIEESLATTPLDEKARRELRLAADEACANILEHAYEGRGGSLRVEIERRGDRASVTLIDHGQALESGRIYKAGSTPDLTRYVATGKKGGLGLFLIRRLTDQVDYGRRDDQNVLTLTRRYPRRLSGRRLVESLPRVRSLRLRYTALGWAGLIAVVLASSLWLHGRQHGAVKRVVLERGITEAAALADQAADLLLSPAQFGPKQTRLIAAAHRAVERPDIDEVVIVDRDGTVWAASDEERVFQYQEPPLGLIELPLGVEGLAPRLADQTLPRNDRYWFGVPVALTDPEAGATTPSIRLGSAYVAINAGEVRRAQQRATQRLIGGAALALVGGLAAITFLIGRVVQPIQRLTEGAREMGSGRQQRLKESGLVEIDGLARAFNEVTERFRGAQLSLLEKERLEQEMEVAQSIQHSLLPGELPEMTGYEVGTFYRAAKEVGGDYYDFVKVGRDAWGLAVADVSGKGVPGSLVMMMIRTALRLEARGERSAAHVLDRVNAFMTGDMKRGMFVTMFYIVLDSSEREIAYASAGHNPMVLYRGETERTYFLNPKGFPVGVDLPDPTLFGRCIGSERVSLNRDDLLVVYTDGITEAMNEQKEQYGMDRFLAVIKRYAQLKPSEFCVKLEQELADWTGDAPQSDDMTLVAIKERLVSDDLKVEARERLLDLVETGKLSVREACEQAGVSPATFYRLRRRRDEQGAAGLKDRRRRAPLHRLSHEDEVVLLELIRADPERGAARLAAALSEALDREVKPHRVYETLRRLGLNTVAARTARIEMDRAS